MSPAAQPSPAPRVDLSGFERLMQEIRNSVTEQQYFHILEGLTNHEQFAVRVAALSNLVSLEVSILSKGADPADEDRWKAAFESCFIGVPVPKAIPSELPGGVVYEIAIYGRDDIPPAEAMPADLNRAIDAQMSVQSMLCSRGLKALHFELRSRLRATEWLKDEFGHEDPIAKAARERERASAAGIVR